MANLQHIAERIFRHADAGHLSVGYALVMGVLIETYEDNPDFHQWADTVQGSDVEKMIACMVRAEAWDDPRWLDDYLKKLRRQVA